MTRSNTIQTAFLERKWARFASMRPVAENSALFPGIVLVYRYQRNRFQKKLQAMPPNKPCRNSKSGKQIAAQGLTESGLGDIIISSNDEMKIGRCEDERARAGTAWTGAARTYGT
jgi:hypothetical protein